MDGEPVDPEQRKGITVKYNGLDVVIPETEVEAHARKGLNYDKIEGRAKQYETSNNDRTDNSRQPPGGVPDVMSDTMMCRLRRAGQLLHRILMIANGDRS